MGTGVFAALAGVLGVRDDDVEVRTGPGSDLLVRAAGVLFVVEVLGTASPGVLADRAERLVAAARRVNRRAVPLLSVPFMSAAGRRVCELAEVSWFDRSGNARIVGPGIRVLIDGKPNRHRGPGRPANLFAPKSARVARWLLENPGRAMTQREIARATDMSEGFVSRISARLEAERYVVRESGGALRVKAPALLLDAWRDAYRFDKHVILKGHVAARSGDALARLVGDRLAEHAVQHAATGLAAAWQMTRFAAFRIATFFLADAPSKALCETLGFREDPRGANLWLVVPNDAGVFHGAEVRDGLRCVHPVQAYMDLDAHPERAAEAAERLRILSCLDAEPLGDGVTHPAEKVVAEALARPDGHRAAFERLLETESSPEVLASLLRLTGRVGRAARREWRRNLVKGALGSPSPMLREAAVEAVEQWEDAELLPLLRAHTEPVAWLKSYIDDVIEDLGG